MRVDPVSDRTEDKLWRLIRQQVPDRKKLQGMSWAQLAVIARELGFEEHARAWERSQVGAR